mgnify:CR=1 FL=1
MRAVPPPVRPETFTRAVERRRTRSPVTVTRPPLPWVLDASSVPETSTPPPFPNRSIEPSAFWRTPRAWTTPDMLMTLSTTFFAAFAVMRTRPPFAVIRPLFLTRAEPSPKTSFETLSPTARCTSPSP